MQQGLSSAIHLFTPSFQRSTYTAGSAAAIAAKELEIAEMEMKRNYIELKTAEMVLKAEESQLKLLELQEATAVEVLTATVTATATT